MKLLTLLVMIVVLVHGKLHAINNHITFRFTSNHSCSYIQPDSILVENLTQGGSKTLYYPDTVLTFVITGTGHIGDQQKELYLSQNYPNPTNGLVTLAFTGEEPTTEIEVEI